MAELTRVHPSMLKDAFFFNTFLIGAIIPLMSAPTYIPYGCLPCDAGEYTRDIFTEFYDKYLIGGKLLTCTYAEYAAQVALTGNCAKFAIDDTAKTFKVPLIKDGDSVTQASTEAELGKSYKAGLPNITAEGIAGIPDTTQYRGAMTVPNTSLTYSTGVGTGIRYNNLLTSTTPAFDASRSSAIYRNDVTTVVNEQIRLRYFVVVANGHNDSSIFDWSRFFGALTSKLDTDFNNFDFTKACLIRQIRRFDIKDTMATTSSIAWVDQLPVSTSGVQCMQVSFTPVSPYSRFIVEAIGQLGTNTATRICFILFDAPGAFATALGAAGVYQTSAELDTVCVNCDITDHLRKYRSSDLTNKRQMTITARFGSHSGTAYLNSTASGLRPYGGALTSSMIVTEYAI